MRLLLFVSVNFSGVQFDDDTLGDHVVRILKEVGLGGSALTVEITETVEMHDRDRVENIIKQLRACNIGFAIDDFGTGYSNVGHLKQMNVDEIKIDRMFVDGILANLPPLWNVMPWERFSP